MPENPSYNLVSSCSQVVEPPTVFDELPASLRHRAPRLVTADGGSAWHLEGAEPIALETSIASGTGWQRAIDAGSTNGAITWDEVMPAVHDPVARVRALWTDSVDAEVLYPTPDLWDAIRQLEDAELTVALVRTYNDWLADFCRQAPDQLIGLAKLPITSVDDAKAELERAVGELGLKGAILDAFPSGAPAGGNEADDPFWSAVNELQVPISFHVGFGPSASTAPPRGIAPGLKPQMADVIHPMVAGGVFDRFPEVKLVLAHADAGWALHWMEFFDINYVRMKHLQQFALDDPDAVPSDYIRKHCWFTFHQDRPAVRNRHRLGAAHLMWASHFPCDDANYPDSRQQAMRVTDETPGDERHALLAGNVARLYGLTGFEKGFSDDEITAFEQLVHF